MTKTWHGFIGLGLVALCLSCGGAGGGSETSVDGAHLGTITGDPNEPGTDIRSEGIPTLPPRDGNVAMYVLVNLCTMVSNCYPEQVFNDCIQHGAQAHGFAERLGLDRHEYPDLYSIVWAADAHTIVPREGLGGVCLAKIYAISCESDTMSAFFHRGDPNDAYRTLAKLLPDNWDECDTLFAP